MAETFTMPKLGMDMEEGINGSWLKAEGEPVQKGEPLAEIETDKAVVTVEAPASGVLLKIYQPEGEPLPCGTPIALIGQPGEAAAEPQNPPVLQPGAEQDVLFYLPKLGMDMEEGVIGSWLKAEGDSVQKGEPLAEIETDKAVVTVESSLSGVVLKLYYPEGEQLPCGAPIAAIGAPGTPVPDPQAPAAPVMQEVQEMPAAPVQTEAPAREPGRVIASPRARRCAEENQVDLKRITGTADNGRIVEQDVLDFLSRQPGKTRQPQDTVVPLAGMRKIIAGRMKESLQQMAQTDMRMDVDMTNMISLRKQLNLWLEKEGIKVSYMDLLTAACARALAENPQANASLGSDGIHYKNYANIGIAVDAERGLVVPVVKDADILSVPEISRRSRELIGKARKGALQPDDMQGGTFTISNLGMFEVDSFTAIVNPPETCILAVGRIADRAVVVDGQVAARPMMNLCLSYDHRIIDGAPAARFLHRVKQYVENPVWLLM